MKWQSENVNPKSTDPRVFLVTKPQERCPHETPTSPSVSCRGWSVMPGVPVLTLTASMILGEIPDSEQASNPRDVTVTFKLGPWLQPPG